MNPQPHQTRAFFGRRKGHKLRPNQARLMETLLPQLAIDLSRPAPAELSELFSVPVGEIALEIGFGGGELRFATDIADYAAWTLQHLLRSPAFDWTAQCADDWRQAWPGFTPTRYHAKAARQQRASCFLIFRRR